MEVIFDEIWRSMLERRYNEAAEIEGVNGKWRRQADLWSHITPLEYS